MDLQSIIKEDFEREYFEGLISKLGKEAVNLSINTEDNKSNVFPTAIASDAILKHLPWSNYEDIKNKYKTTDKVDACLWLRKMHGGIGSSIERSSYLKAKGIDQIGAKGTDLFINTKNGEISIAEAQLIQAEKKTESFSEVIYQNILNEDIKDKFEELWTKADLKKVKKFKTLVQTNVPTLDEEGELTLERTAPSGHGLFGYEIIKSIFDETQRPRQKNLICCIGNGEDLSSTPDRSIVNWMLNEDIPICMLTTTKTDIDVKGGQIALKKNDDQVYLTIIEKAQAEKSGQLELFSELGLREGDREAFFNTNLVLLNIDLLLKLFKDSDKEEILERAIPDLIQNQKVQNGKKYIQLEGAIGSSFLNLDKYWREHKNENLVHILNIPTKYRTRFFSPIKSAFDFFIQFHSDRFTFNEETYHLSNNKPGKLPKINLPDDYKDITKVIDDFEGASLLNLDSIKLTKRQSFKNLSLKGNVTN